MRILSYSVLAVGLTAVSAASGTDPSSIALYAETLLQSKKLDAAASQIDRLGALSPGDVREANLRARLEQGLDRMLQQGLRRILQQALHRILQQGIQRIQRQRHRPERSAARRRSQAAWLALVVVRRARQVQRRCWIR